MSSPSSGSDRFPNKHHRSKSSLVSALLSVNSSSSKVGSRPRSPSTSTTHTPMNSSQQQLSASVSGNGSNTQPSACSSVAPSRSDTMDVNESMGSLQSPAAVVAGPVGGGGGGGSGGGAKSVEETVRTFRLYEALRSGDTAAISKAIRESPAEDSSRRTSTSSLLSGAGGGHRSSILHLAVQCAELPVIEFILSTTTSNPDSAAQKPHVDINERELASGNTPLHIAAQLGRTEVVSLLLRQPNINDAVHNYANRTPLEMARTPQIFQMLQLARSMFLEDKIEMLHELVQAKEYGRIEELLDNARVKGLLDLNTLEPPDAPGSTFLHEAARKRDTKLIQLLLMHGADPFRRDRKGKLPQDVTKDEKTRGVLKRSPAAVAAARGIEERAVLGSAAEHAPPGHQGSGEGTLGSKETREMKGYLKKWTNYTGGYKLRWFVLEDGVLSYYKNQEDIGSACRGAINMRIAKLHIDPADKQRFEIHGKGSVKYHLKANHMVEAKRWFWTLNNAIQQAKDEARIEDRKKREESEVLDRLREQAHNDEAAADSDAVSEVRGQGGSSISGPEVVAPVYNTSPNRRASVRASHGGDRLETGAYGPKPRSIHTDGDLGDDEGDEIEDDASSHAPDLPPTSDALALVANSARLQLDLLSQVALALRFEHAGNPELMLGDASVVAAMSSYESAVGSLGTLIGDLLRMSKERDQYWRHRMEKEVALRRLWEESMMKLAEEQETLEGKVVGERERRKKTKRALKRVLRKDSGKVSRHEGEQAAAAELAAEVQEPAPHDAQEGVEDLDARLQQIELDQQGAAKRSLDTEEELSDSDESDDQFFDAIDAGQLEVATEMPNAGLKSPPVSVAAGAGDDGCGGDGRLGGGGGGSTLRERKLVAIRSAFAGYEDAPRQRLAMDDDDRPKISLWGILKSMIGKDMTKMTLPVSFNEPTSLLQRVAEDMEYTDLLDMAADRPDAAERMVYVAAFAASEYSSTTGRVAKPFNPLLGETFEYCRPDKKYRFFVEQVSHHPPVGAAHAEAEKWDYWGESAVRSKFYGKSFDINPLGTWFLRLRPVTGGEELYTWKKVTTSVIGIITGNPQVDNYGLMEIKNWNTGVACYLDFKARGWRGANAYEVKGRVVDGDGTQMWSVGGRWNDKLYARLSPGYDAAISPPPSVAAAGLSTTPRPGGGSGGGSGGGGGGGGGSSSSRHNTTGSAFLIWENNARPPAPFNLTPFAITLNALPERLRPHLCPTDTRLRPDQRAMEDGEYEFAATEKNRLEEKQRAKRRANEEHGIVPEPRWFRKTRCGVTGEDYWQFTDEYWAVRARVARGEGPWEGVDDIF